jgi:hypothetical protein
MNDILPIIRQLFSAYPHAQAEDGTIVVYVRLLRDISPSDLQAVVDQAIAECKFLPTVAEIRERYHLLTRTLGQLSASEAWGLVVKAFRSSGRMVAARDIFEGPTLRAVEIMGWRTLCDSEDQMADRAHFMKIYDQLVSREDQMQKLLPQARALLPDSAQRGMVSIRELLASAKVGEG